MGVREDSETLVRLGGRSPCLQLRSFREEGACDMVNHHRLASLIKRHRRDRSRRKRVLPPLLGCSSALFHRERPLERSLVTTSTSETALWATSLLCPRLRREASALFCPTVSSIFARSTVPYDLIDDFSCVKQATSHTRISMTFSWTPASQVSPARTHTARARQRPVLPRSRTRSPSRSSPRRTSSTEA